MIRKMFWDQETYLLNMPDEFTPLRLCEELGERGREALLEILVINYADEVKKMTFELAKVPSPLPPMERFE